jgi:hypothetical protein
MPTLQAERRETERQIDRGGGFADAALARGDRDDRLDPGTPGGSSRRRARGRGRARRAGAGGRPGRAALRSAVSAPARIARPAPRAPPSRPLAHRSQAFTCAASTVIEKNTLPSVAHQSESAPVWAAGCRRGS